MAPMPIERIALLIGALALPQDSTKSPQEQLRDTELLLSQLLDLQARVRGGELPSSEELALASVSRERVLSNVEVARAAELGIAPVIVRDRLLPGFAAELRLLADQRVALDVGPAAEPSPLLTLLLDLEQEIFRAADRRRQKLGIKSPLDSGPLSQKLNAAPRADAVPDGATPTSPDANAKPPAEASAPAVTLPKGADPRIFGQALYRAGRYADALSLWKDVAPPVGDAGIEFEYQRADCLFKVGRVDDAIAAWQKLATDHPKTSWGDQSEFALEVARALAAFRTAKTAADKTPAADAPKQGGS